MAKGLCLLALLAIISGSKMEIAKERFVRLMALVHKPIAEFGLDQTATRDPPKKPKDIRVTAENNSWRTESASARAP